MGKNREPPIFRGLLSMNSKTFQAKNLSSIDAKIELGG